MKKQQMAKVDNQRQTHTHTRNKNIDQNAAVAGRGTTEGQKHENIWRGHRKSAAAAPPRRQARQSLRYTFRCFGPKRRRVSAEGFKNEKT